MKFKFDQNNTEGNYPTAFVADHQEIKKGNKVLATDLTDLYDVSISDPQNSHYLIYDSQLQKWVNREVHGESVKECFKIYGFDQELINGVKFFEIGHFGLDAGCSYIIYTNNNDNLIVSFTDKEFNKINCSPLYCFAPSTTPHKIKHLAIGNWTIAYITGDDNKLYIAANRGLLPYGNAGFSLLDTDVKLVALEKTKADRINAIVYIKYDNTIWAAGNIYYYDDESDYNPPSPPKQIGTYLPDLEWKSVELNNCSIALLSTDGRLFCIGINYSGRFGLGATGSFRTFTEVESDVPYEKAYLYDMSMKVIKKDGTFWGSGYQYDGLNESSIFVQIGTDTDWVDCNSVNIAKKHDGTFWVCGGNNYGSFPALYDPDEHGYSGIHQYTPYPDNNIVDMKCGNQRIEQYNQSVLFLDKDNKLLFGGKYRYFYSPKDFYTTEVHDYYSYLTLYNFSTGYYYIDETLEINGNGSSEYPFNSLRSFYNNIRYTCRSIERSTDIILMCLSDVHIYNEILDITLDDGNNVIIDLNGNSLIFSPTLYAELWYTPSGAFEIKTNVEEKFLKLSEGMGGKFRNLKIVMDPIYDNLSYHNTFRTVKTGEDHTIMMKKDGEYYSLWGCGNKLMLDLVNDPVPDNPYEYEVKRLFDHSSVFSYMDTKRHTMVIRYDGVMFGMGYNEYSQIGIGLTDFQPNFVKVIDFSSNIEWASVSCGTYHTMAIKRNGTLWGCGKNDVGQLGFDDKQDRLYFERIGVDDHWEKVVCGEDYTIALKTDGTLWAAGKNDHYQLGFNHNVDVIGFHQVGTDTDWKDIACGKKHTIALKFDGRLFGTGLNNYGQLGTGNTYDVSGFTELPCFMYTNHNYSVYPKKLYCSDFATAIISTPYNIDGYTKAYATGKNDKGQFGMNNKYSTTTFIELDADSLVDISINSSHGAIIKHNGCVYASGDNSKGQCGHGEFNNYKTFMHSIGAVPIENVNLPPDIIPHQATMNLHGINIDGKSTVVCENSIVNTGSQQFTINTYHQEYEMKLELTVNMYPIHTTEFSYIEFDGQPIKGLHLENRSTCTCYNTTEINDITIEYDSVLLVENDDDTLNVSVNNISNIESKIIINHDTYQL